MVLGIELVRIAQAAAGLNTLLLVGLGYVWGRNYLQFRSKHTLSLFVFAGLLFAENAFALYYYLVDPTLSAWFATKVPDVAWTAMLAFHVLEFGALAVLFRATWD